MTRTATARASSNIAFIKYWGNRDDSLRLPANSSLSMNLDGLTTTTTITYRNDLMADALTLNGVVQSGEPLRRASAHLNALRSRLGITEYAAIESANSFPTGAGIASSASGFAALTAAAVAAAGLTVDERTLTTLARLGSGSASRSIPTGFVEWHAADTHEESFAESIAPPDSWDLIDFVAIVSEGHKKTGSTEGHGSAQTSPFQMARVAGAAERLETCKRAFFAHDFPAFAEVVEQDSNMMHAVMMTSRPPLFYWEPLSLAIMDRVRKWRADGLSVCYTLDAGANVHCLCLSADADEVRNRLTALSEGIRILSAAPGGPATLDS